MKIFSNLVYKQKIYISTYIIDGFLTVLFLLIFFAIVTPLGILLRFTSFNPLKKKRSRKTSYRILTSKTLHIKSK